MIESKSAKVLLILAPHPDDAELSCGGTIARLCEEGWEIHVAVLSPNDVSLPSRFAIGTLQEECQAAISVLCSGRSRIHWGDFSVREYGVQRQMILEWFLSLKRALRPGWVFCPNDDDCHQDHEVVRNEAIRAFKDVNVLFYESPWNSVKAELNFAIRLDSNHLTKKEQALSSYSSQIFMKRPYFAPDFIRSWARFRGGQWGLDYAELFRVYKLYV